MAESADSHGEAQRGTASSSRARQNTPSSIASVKRPVCVFCCHN
jgi:hypothetical protein